MGATVLTKERLIILIRASFFFFPRSRPPIFPDNILCLSPGSVDVHDPPITLVVSHGTLIVMKLSLDDFTVKIIEGHRFAAKSVHTVKALVCKRRIVDAQMNVVGR